MRRRVSTRSGWLRMRNNLTGDVVGRSWKEKEGWWPGRERGVFFSPRKLQLEPHSNLCNFGANAKVTKMEIVATSIAITSHPYDGNVPPIILSRRLRHGCSVASRANAN